MTSVRESRWRSAFWDKASVRKEQVLRQVRNIVNACFQREFEWQLPVKIDLTNKSFGACRTGKTVRREYTRRIPGIGDYK